MSKERKLTKAEERRKAQLEVLCEEMDKQGYKPVELKIDIVAANVFALVVAAPFLLLVLVPYVMLHGNPLAQDYNMVLFVVAILVGIVVHELIHGLTWSSFTKDGWKSIEFGVIWQYLTPYCTCREPMKKVPMILAAIMPTIVLGFVPAIVGILTGQAILILFAAALIIGGGGDMMIIWNIVKYRTEASEVLYLDHPYEVGTFVFEK